MGIVYINGKATSTYTHLVLFYSISGMCVCAPFCDILFLFGAYFCHLNYFYSSQTVWALTSNLNQTAIVNIWRQSWRKKAIFEVNVNGKANSFLENKVPQPSNNNSYIFYFKVYASWNYTHSHACARHVCIWN